jgi:Coenzyme PQQ synthesis protein D (PqqD)
MATLRRHPEVVYTELEDGAVLLHLETKFYYSLNETGRTIWDMLEHVGTAAAVTRRLLSLYQVTEDRARASVSRFLSELDREQLIVTSPSDGSATPMAEGDDGATSARPARTTRQFSEPELIKHDEPLHEVVMNPFDPQLPLAE